MLYVLTSTKDGKTFVDCLTPELKLSNQARQPTYLPTCASALVLETLEMVPSHQPRRHLGTRLKIGLNQIHD